MVGAVTSALLKEVGETWDEGHERAKANFQIGTSATGVRLSPFSVLDPEPPTVSSSESSDPSHHPSWSWNKVHSRTPSSRSLVAAEVFAVLCIRPVLLTVLTMQDQFKCSTLIIRAFIPIRRQGTGTHPT